MANNRNVPILLSLADIAATDAFAAHVVRELKPGDVIGLSGDLGMGKTVLARSIIRSLATETKRCILISGCEDIFASEVSLIEWPERLGVYLPANHLHLTLLPGDHDNDRILQIDKFGSWQNRDLGVSING